MSAFMVDKDHIDILVYLALHGPKDKAQRWEPIRWASKPYVLCTTLEEMGTVSRQARFEEADTIGAMLTKANADSLIARYGDDPDSFDLNYSYPYSVGRPVRVPTIVEAIKATRCFEYQSCEVPAWRDTEAFSFCGNLLSNLETTLPGYEVASWEWRQPELSTTD